jgi:hypothetical protein
MRVSSLNRRSCLLVAHHVDPGIDRHGRYRRVIGPPIKAICFSFIEAMAPSRAPVSSADSLPFLVLDNILGVELDVAIVQELLLKRLEIDRVIVDWLIFCCGTSARRCDQRWRIRESEHAG